MSKTPDEKQAYLKAWRATHIEHTRAYKQANAARLKAQRQAYRLANAERIKAKKKAYREANIERERAYQHAYDQARQAQRQAYYQVTKPQRQIRAQAYYEANKDQINAAARAWQRANRAKRLAIEQRYVERHPDAIKAKKSTDYARRRNVTIRDFTAAQWATKQAAWQYRCHYCPPTCWECTRELHKLTKDHVIPVTKGGHHTDANIVPACRSCNAKKGNRSLS